MNSLQEASSPSAPGPAHHFAKAAQFWEPWRLSYNVVLAAVFFTWVLATWPHFRGVFRVVNLLKFGVLALLANACYCAAYGVDLPLQASSFAPRWQRWRWSLWLVGTLFAVVLESYWIADEIYPDFQ